MADPTNPWWALCECAFLLNPKTTTEKVQFAIDSHAQSRTSIFRPCVMEAFSSLQAKMQSAIVTDKGHSSSKGFSIVEFWIKMPETNIASHETGTQVEMVACNDADCKMEAKLSPAALK